MWSKEKQKSLDKLLKEKAEHEEYVVTIDQLIEKLKIIVENGCRFSVEVRRGDASCYPWVTPTIYEITIYE